MLVFWSVIVTNLVCWKACCLEGWQIVWFLPPTKFQHMIICWFLPPIEFQLMISRLVKADVQSSLGLELVSNPRLAVLSSGNFQNINNILQSSNSLESKFAEIVFQVQCSTKWQSRHPHLARSLPCALRNKMGWAFFFWSVEEMWKQLTCLFLQLQTSGSVREPRFGGGLAPSSKTSCCDKSSCDTWGHSPYE